MYNETNVPGPEYRVRTVVRYIVTRYCHPYHSVGGSPGMTGSSTAIGEFQNEDQAYAVAEALADREKHCGATVSV